MADINIERKSGMGIWPWVLGAILLALVAWLVLGLGRDRNSTGAVVTDTTAYGPVAAEQTSTATGTAAGAGMGTAAPAGAGAASDYVTFVDQRIVPAAQQQGQVDRTVDHETTAEGLRRLAAAIEAMHGGQGGAAPGDAQTRNIREQADRLERSSPQEPHSDMVRSAFDSAADALAGLERGGSHAAQVREAAQRIQPTVPLNDQAQPLRAAFEATRDAVRAASGR